MTTTPPPPGRLRTPPPPQHGPRYDNHEPYSPRRSSRVAAQRSAETSFSSSRSARASTPHTNHHSPTIGRKRRSPSPESGSDSDTDILLSNLNRLKPSSAADSFGMLHTPAKTPRKRAVPKAAMNGTARALFPGRPATADEAMPTPKKARMKIFNPFDIAENIETASSQKIEIYTDSKERVPTLDEDEANPFLSRNAAKPNKRRKKKATEDEMDEAVRNDEGLLYVFRGKKTFRRFDDGQDDDDDDNPSDLEVRRKSGVTNKHFTRSSIKPRLLFPSEEQRRAREAAEEADEEAVANVEVPQPKQSTTPTKQHFQPTTPPSTGRSKRLAANAALEQVSASAKTAVIKTSKKISPFGGWARKKSGDATTASASRKREGEPLGAESASKRTRSGAS